MRKSSLQLRHNERDDISNHRHPNCLFRRDQRKHQSSASKRTSKAENVSIWWSHHDLLGVASCVSSPLQQSVPCQCWKILEMWAMFCCSLIICWSLSSTSGIFVRGFLYEHHITSWNTIELRYNAVSCNPIFTQQDYNIPNTQKTPHISPYELWGVYFECTRTWSRDIESVLYDVFIKLACVQPTEVMA